MDKKLDWTHKDIKITDIRKLGDVYLFTIDDKKINTPIKIGEKIFQQRLSPYFLKDWRNINREDIKSVTWNMYLSKGHFIKLDENNQITEHPRNFDPEGWYVSYLEISGPLGSFKSVLKK